MSGREAKTRQGKRLEAGGESLALTPAINGMQPYAVLWWQVARLSVLAHPRLVKYLGILKYSETRLSFLSASLPKLQNSHPANSIIDSNSSTNAHQRDAPAANR